MKIAVLVYGEFREFDTVVKSWEFLKRLNCDVYVSTWDYSFQENKNLGIKREKFVTEEMITSVLPNAKVSILKESDYFEDFHLPHNMKKRTRRVVVHWKNLLRMVNESDEKYDILILNRTDNFTVFQLEEPHLKEMSQHKDRIYGLGHIYLAHKNTFHLIDLILYGSSETISKIISTCPDDLDCIHHDLSLHIMSCDLYVEVKSLVNEVGIGVFRPNSLELGENIDIHKVAQKHVIWEQTMIKE